VGDGDDAAAVMAALDHRRPGLGGCAGYGTASIVNVLAVAAAAEVGGCSCRGCGGGSVWARGLGHAAGCRHGSWLPSCRVRRGVSSGRAWARGRRGAVSESTGASRGKGAALSTSAAARDGALGAAKPPGLRRSRDTRLDAATAAGCRRTAWVAGCRRRRQGCLVLGLGSGLGGGGGGEGAGRGMRWRWKERRLRSTGFCAIWDCISSSSSSSGGGCGGAWCWGWDTASAVVVREGVGEGVGTRGWMPPRQLVAVVPRGS